MTMTRAELHDLAPEVVRQRLLIEGRFTRDIDERTVRDFLLCLAGALELRTYGEPVVYSPSAGAGREENAGFDAFVPLIDSGISAYFWTEARFCAVLLFTCKGFDETRAVGYTRQYLGIDGDVVTHAF